MYYIYIYVYCVFIRMCACMCIFLRQMTLVVPPMAECFQQSDVWQRIWRANREFWKCWEMWVQNYRMRTTKSLSLDHFYRHNGSQTLWVGSWFQIIFEYSFLFNMFQPYQQHDDDCPIPPGACSTTMMQRLRSNSRLHGGAFHYASVSQTCERKLECWLLDSVCQFIEL